MKTTFKQLTLNLDLGLLLPFLFPPPSPAEEGDPQGNHGHHHDYHHTHLVDIIQFVRNKISDHELQPRIMSGWFSLTNQNPAGPFLVCFSFLNKIVFCLATGFLK